MALFRVEAPIIQSIQPYHDHSRSTSCNNEFVAERALISTLALDSVPILYRRIMKLLIDSPRQSPIANASDGGTVKV